MLFYIDLLSAQICTTECRHLASIDGADLGYCITTRQLWKYSIGLDISCIGSDYSECTTQVLHSIRIVKGLIIMPVCMKMNTLLYYNYTANK